MIRENRGLLYRLSVFGVRAFRTFQITRYDNHATSTDKTGVVTGKLKYSYKYSYMVHYLGVQRALKSKSEKRIDIPVSGILFPLNMM